MGEVVSIKSVPAKSETAKYRGHVITITYIVSTQAWEYEFTKTSTYTYRDRKPTLDKAKKAAQVKIDQILS